MASNEMTLDLKLNTAFIKAGSKAISLAFSAIQKSAQNVETTLADVFRINGYKDYVQTAARYGKELASSLLVLQLRFGQLKAAIADAVAPVAAVFVPMLNQALLAAIRFTNGVGAVFSALFGGNDALTQSTQKAETAQENLADSVRATGKAVKKSLASFDQIDRLSAPTGGSSATSTAQTAQIIPDKVEDTLSPQLQAIVDKIRAILVPLQAINFTALQQALGRLKIALEPFTQELFAGLKWAYDNLFVPLATWTIQDFLPAFLNALSAAMSVLNEIIIALKPLALWLWESFLQPIAQWTGGVIVEVLQWLTEKLTGVSNWISKHQKLVEGIAVVIASVAAAIGAVNGVLSLWNGLSVAAAVVTGAFKVAMGALTSPITLVVGAIAAVIAIVVLLIQNWDTVKTVAIQVWESIKAAWGNACGWFQQNLLTPLANGFRNMVNGVIGFINGMIAGIVAGINAVVGAVNKISFTVPSWIPVLGNKRLGFNLSTISAPQIPYLAQGAVLPANKPFLAMVGDQRYGTNIEAPLATIEQALANVLTSQNSGSQTVVRVNFNGDLAQLARVLKPAIETETRRIGGSLAKEAFG